LGCIQAIQDAVAANSATISPVHNSHLPADPENLADRHVATGIIRTLERSW
jgi:hypothetical protein